MKYAQLDNHHFIRANARTMHPNTMKKARGHQLELVVVPRIEHYHPPIITFRLSMQASNIEGVIAAMPNAVLL
jgi:hypothetical protein